MRSSGDIEIVQGREPNLPRATCNVVIDVLRAFTTVHVAFEHGCEEVVLAETVDEAFRLDDLFPEYLLAGERDARKVEGFDFGNSPQSLLGTDLEGRGLVLTTSNGVRAATNALDAEEILVTGWSNVPATVEYLRTHRETADREPDRPDHLVASHPVSDEDLACAEFLAGQLDWTGTPPTPAEVVERIRSARSAQKFYGPEFLLRDLDLACRQWTSGYAMTIERGPEAPRIRPTPI